MFGFIHGRYLPPQVVLYRLPLQERIFQVMHTREPPVSPLRYLKQYTLKTIRVNVQMPPWETLLLLVVQLYTAVNNSTIAGQIAAGKL